MFYEKIRLNFIHLVEGCGHPAPRLIEITKPCVSILVENQIKKGNSKISHTLPNEGNTFDRSKVLCLSRVSIRNIHAGICGGRQCAYSSHQPNAENANACIPKNRHRRKNSLYGYSCSYRHFLTYNVGGCVYMCLCVHNNTYDPLVI